MIGFRLIIEGDRLQGLESAAVVGARVKNDWTVDVN